MSKVLDEYARQVRAGLLTKPGYDPITHCALGLTGEAGEVADLVKKSQYLGASPIDRGKLFAELGDVLWYLQWLAAEYGWTIENVAVGNILKLENRGRVAGYDADKLIDARTAA